MPSLRVCGHSWCFASDDLPIPTAYGAFIQVVWMMFFGWGVEEMYKSPECIKQVPFESTIKGLLVLFGISAVLKICICIVSARGNATTKHFSSISQACALYM